MTGFVDSEDDFVFYGNPEHYSRSVRSGGDNRTGEGEGDDVVSGNDVQDEEDTQGL